MDVETVARLIDEHNVETIKVGGADIDGVYRGKRLLRDHVVPKPVIVEAKCTRCGQCIEICPTSPKSVDWVDGNRKRPPKHQYATCIRCYCCQELCPESAIVIKTPWLGRLVPR